MSSEPNKTVARRYFKAYETGDIEAVMKFIAPNYILHPGGDGEPMNPDERKRDEMVFFSGFSNIRTVIEDQIAEGDKVANRITMHCTHTGEYQSIPPTRKRIAIPYLDILQIKAGKIIEEWVEFDMMSITRQISVRKEQQRNSR
jgi:predicted ester cyclase